MYQIKTIQYGADEEIKTHETLRALLDDLNNIAVLRSVQVVEVLQDGKPVNVEPIITGMRCLSDVLDECD